MNSLEQMYLLDTFDLHPKQVIYEQTTAKQRRRETE